MISCKKRGGYPSGAHFHCQTSLASFLATLPTRSAQLAWDQPLATGVYSRPRPPSGVSSTSQEVPMNHTPRRTHLHLLALCVLIAPAALARNFGPRPAKDRRGKARPSRATKQSCRSAAPASSAIQRRGRSSRSNCRTRRDALASGAAQLHHHAQCHAGRPALPGNHLIPFW